MKRFSFRLDSVLKYRRHLEKSAQRDLFSARNEQRGREMAVRNLGNKRTEITKKCSDEAFQGIDVPRYLMYRSFLEKLHLDLESAQTALREGEDKVEAKRAALTQETVRKKTLEVLKDSQLKEYLLTLERQNQKEMDELVIIRRGERA